MSTLAGYAPGHVGECEQSALAVGEHQRVFLVAVFEIVENAVLGHDAGEEIEGGFVVLDGVFALRVGFGEGFPDVDEALRLCRFFDDFGNSHVLVDGAGGGVAEQMEPGAHFQNAAGGVDGGFFLSGCGDDGPALGCFAVGPSEGDGVGFGDEGGEGDFVCSLESVFGEGVGMGEGLLAFYR